MVDQQSFDFPHLQHVFAAGNEGEKVCSTYPLGFHTVFGSYTSAKNVITVGATEWNGSMWSGSSKGPVEDGRTKPEITAMGSGVYSGALNSGYGYGWGTSMAAPAVTGGMALLYQRYRQLNGGANPKSGLMKALLCNGGADLGNKGPDFQYGFGWMNLLRSVEVLEKGHYKMGSLTNGGEQSYTITVPAATAQLKVMLYWNDPPASPMSSRALVNDLDLRVSDPSMVVNLPRVLDPSAAGVLNTATTGADHVNNMEQVVIDQPAPGTYTLNISGIVAQNPTQEYFIVYDIIPVSTTVTYPAGGEGLMPGETVQINWDAYGEPAGTFKLQYSADNGASWTDIATAIEASSRRYAWVVPHTPTHQALIRIERNGTGLSDTTHPFTILGVPTLSLAPVQCEGYIALSWTAVPGATDYEVMMKRDNEMVPVATTPSTTYTLTGLSADSLYWVSVRARLGGKAGRRAVALSRQPDSGTCAGTISDQDLKLDTLVSTTVGRKYTATELSATSKVTIRVKNLDDEPVSGFTVRYKIDSKDWVLEPVNVTIPAGASYDHTFATTEDFSGTGSYSLVTVVENQTPDPMKANDTLKAVIRQLDNQPLDLTTPFLDDLESAVAAVYTKETMGLAGIDRYDFTDRSSHGRLSTFANWGTYYGTKVLVMTFDRNTENPTGEEFITGTYNLSRYDARAHDVRLNFKASSSASNFWVRGSDDQSWIELLDLQSPAYSGDNFANIELSDSLLKYGQNFSSSFQLKWSNEPGSNTTLILDDVHIYEGFDDVQLNSIDPVFAQSCGGEPLWISLRNSSNKVLTNVPVRFRTGEGAWITETIPSIAPNTTIRYKFNTPPNFNAPGTYSIKVWVDFPTDNIRTNDTSSVVVSYAPLIKTFPYFQNFENGNGGWYAIGANSTWEYGTYVSSISHKPASGTQVWKTNQVVNANDYEYTYLYSPCFDVSGLKNPTISFSIAMDLYGVKDTIFDVAWVEYAVDKDIWSQLIDTVSAGTNWYIPDGNYSWDRQKSRWHVVTMGLPRNVNVIRLRIGRFKHPDAPTKGLAIDDIHIYDSTRAIYEGISPCVTVTQPVIGNEWVHFESEGKLIASVHPNGQNLGTTNVQAFIHPGTVRYTPQQYYHNRNITIKPEVTTFSDSARVRLYFLDSETEALINATGCSGCTKPQSAYELGVSKYSDPVDERENGTLEDNNSGMWSFIPSTNVTIVPFQKGYYAEFKVREFSEFWLSNGGVDGFTSLPLKLMDFTAQKRTAGDVLLQWRTAQETNVSSYEVELAKGEADLQAGRFIKIGMVKAVGNSAAAQSYSFTDTEPHKITSRFYRLKMIDKDESFVYSAVRSVLFSNPTTWQVYPNPSDGKFTLVNQLHTTGPLEVTVYDVNGRLLKQYRKPPSGAVQRLEVDLSPSTFAPGIYLLRMVVNGRREFFKLHKL